MRVMKIEVMLAGSVHHEQWGRLTRTYADGHTGTRTLRLSQDSGSRGAIGQGDSRKVEEAPRTLK